MIEQIKIDNFALIKSLELKFASGFNVLLGETGAGKSIILGALNFVLGGKADKSIIRSGEEIAKVSAVFSSTNKKVGALLESFGFESADEVLVYRSFNMQGKSEARINGQFATVGMLRELGALLVDSYNQNEQVELTKSKNHLRILDSFRPESLKEYKNKLADLLEELGINDSQIKKLGGSEENRARTIDILTYQISEIESSNLKDGEEVEINETLSRISQSEKVLSAIGELNGLLSGEDFSVISAILTAKNKLSAITGNPELEEIADRLSGVAVELEDISGEFEEIFEKYSFDENKINALIQRREEIDNLRHKYGNGYKEIMKFYEKAKQELETLQNAESELALLNVKRKEIDEKICAVAEKLSKERKQNAKEIESLMQEGLKEVGIKNSKFQICFEKEPVCTELGNDSVEFMFSANLGEELKPLSKTISGGEMSRFMLVLKNILAETGGAETIIFDEIDSGISGQIADEVAVKIEKLSKLYQIICITHLPQVASKGDNFINVFKGEIDGRTQTQVKILCEDEIVQQIAKTASGSVSQASLDYAKELRNKKNKE